jgi:hypothetical protein
MSTYTHTVLPDGLGVLSVGIHRLDRVSVQGQKGSRDIYAGSPEDARRIANLAHQLCQGMAQRLDNGTFSARTALDLALACGLDNALSHANGRGGPQVIATHLIAGAQFGIGPRATL